MTTRATGRLLRHDPASRAYAAPIAPVVQKSWMHTMGPVLDQGQISGCTGWSGADFLNASKAKGNRKRYNAKVHPGTAPTGYLGNPDGLALYEAATRNDDFDWTYPPTDNGSTGLGVAKALKAMGAIDAYAWTFDFGQLLAWGIKQPIMLGTLWTDAMMEPDARGIIHVGTDAQVKAAEDNGEGHEYLLRGVTWSRKLARIRNHWTDQWGIRGEAYISLDDLERLVIGEHGDVCVPEIVAT